MAEFDGLALIHAVTDLSEILGRRSSIQDFLADLTKTVAEHLRSEVCSVYLYDVEHDVLVLRATVGLNPDLIGHVRLASGEGLTGHAFLHNSPVIERNSSGSSINKAIPDLGEEAYPVFLGVPIKRNNLGIGVLTLQYRKDTGLGNHELRTLRSLASHLAAALENAAVLYEVHEHDDAPHAQSGPFESGLLHGTSASKGIGIGMVEFLDRRSDAIEQEEVRSLDEAIEYTERQLQELQRHVEEQLSDVASMIFSSHLLMMRDESFVGAMRTRHAQGTKAAAAVQELVDDFSQRFMAIPDPRFQEKVQDVQDLGHRIVRNLREEQDAEGDYRGQVVAAHEIFPSELVKLYVQNVEGIAFSGGGATSHVALLAQSLKVPVVACSDPRLFEIRSGTRVVIDADDGKIVVEPSPAILEAYRARVPARSARAQDWTPHPIPDTVLTADGSPIKLLANVNLVKDARQAHALNAHGIGLYRSEIPFLIRNGFPTEDEQTNVYRRVVEEMPGRPVAFRVMDLGGDKLLSSQFGVEHNPFLGFRGVRFLLEHRDLLREQLRAMLRASAGVDLGILIPMVSNLEEVRAVKEEIAASIDELSESGITIEQSPRVGVMVEIPATVDIAPELAQIADFLSVGTNDLIMYTLAADRANHRVADIYRSIHPSVLRGIARLVDGAKPYGTPISVCGASAADPAMAAFYVGIGIRSLSVNAESLPDLARIIAQMHTGDAEAAAGEMLATADRARLAEIADRVRRRHTHE